MQAVRRISTVLLAITLAGCSSLDFEVASAQRKAQPTHKQRQDCQARGGGYEPVGMLGLPGCVVPFADGGKACSTKSDCQGRCLTDAGDPATSPATGVCEKTNQTFGCFAEVVDGKVGPGICVD